MTPRDLIDLSKMVHDAAGAELERKAPDYAPEGVVFVDIIQQCAETGVEPEQLLWIMMQKHLTALRTYAQTGKLTSEPLVNRTIDVINYAAFISIWASNSAQILRDIRALYLARPCACPHPHRPETRCSRCEVLVWFERYRGVSPMASIFGPV